MDNDNKITGNKKTENLHKEVMLFLGDEVEKIHQKSTDNSYDMEKEYAKTKKNHSPVNFFVLFGAFIVVIATVFFINRYISVKDQKISVSLDEFEDLNLNNLLNTVAAAQVNYDSALKNKLILEAEMETKLSDLKADFENEIFVIDSMNLSNKRDYNTRVNKAETEYNAGVKEVKEEYEERILLAQKQVDAYKAQLDEFDTEKVAAAQEKEKLINSERELRQLEIDKIVASYEARLKNMEDALNDARSNGSSEMRNAVQDVATKYQAEINRLDPKLNDSRANGIINSSNTVSDFDGQGLLQDASVDDTKVIDAVNEYQNLYNDYKYLDDVIKSIPQKYSIPKYVRTARNLVNGMGKTYVDTTVGYYQYIQELNKMIEDLNLQLEVLNTQVEDLNGELDEQQVQFEQDLNNTKKECENSISNIFTSLDVNAMLLSAPGYNNIQISVNPAISELIPASGISGEIIVSSEVVIPGTIIPKSNGAYYFVVDNDAFGNLIPVDFSTLYPGMPVEILW